MRGVDCFVATLLAMTVSRRAHTPAVIARLDRAIQYSKDVCDKIEKPRRTGYPAGACHRARRKRDPVAGYDGLLCSSACAFCRSYETLARRCEVRSGEASRNRLPD